MENCGNFSIFLWAFVNELWLTKKKEEEEEEEEEEEQEQEEEEQNDIFCGRITRQNKRSGKLRV